MLYGPEEESEYVCACVCIGPRAIICSVLRLLDLVGEHSRPLAGHIPSPDRMHLEASSHSLLSMAGC